MLEIYGTTLVALLVAVYPLGLVPVFIALTRDLEPAQQRQMAGKGVIVGIATLGAFALLGERLLGTIGVTMPAFRIAGGAVLFLLALEMVFDRRERRRVSTAETVAEERPGDDIATFPLAIPLIAGPAAITTVILSMGRHGGSLEGALAVAAALVSTGLLTWAALLLAVRIERLLGPTLIGVLSRVLGLLLAALAVQFVLDGLREAYRFLG